jgi:hypothetical protein
MTPEFCSELTCRERRRSITMNRHVHGEDALRLASPMQSAVSFRCESRFNVFRGPGGSESAVRSLRCYTLHRGDSSEYSSGTPMSFFGKASSVHMLLAIVMSQICKHTVNIA